MKQNHPYYVADNTNRRKVSADFDTYEPARQLTAQRNTDEPGGRYGVYQDGVRVWGPTATNEMGRLRADASECTCVVNCAEHPPTACSLSGTPHVHPDDGRGIFGACPEHPEAPGDL